MFCFTQAAFPCGPQLGWQLGPSWAARQGPVKFCPSVPSRTHLSQPRMRPMRGPSWFRMGSVWANSWVPMRNLEDHCGQLVTSTCNTVRSLDPAVPLVPNYSPLVGLPERLLGGLHGPSLGPTEIFLGLRDAGLAP